MSVTYCDDHASLSLPSDNHHQYISDLTSLNNWSTVNDTNYYNAYISLWNTNPISVISMDAEGKLSVHKKLVDAIMNMIMDNEELKEKLLSMLMERVLKKNSELKLNASELQKTFS